MDYPRRSIIWTSGLPLFAASLAMVLTSTSIAWSQQDIEELAEHPNIVLILADDLGYGDLGCYGATKVKTPQMDRLASEGMRFTDAHSPSSVCTPTRYGLLTGRYCWRTWAGSSGIWANDPLVIENGRPTIATLLGDAGYRTAIVGKLHLGFGRPGAANWDDLHGVDYNGEIKPGPLECGFAYFFGIPHVGQLPHIYIRNHHVVGAEKLSEPLRLCLDPDKPAWHVPYGQRPRDVGKSPWLTMENAEPISYRHEDLAVRLTEEAVDWIERQSDQQPFFLYFAHRNPHVPWRAHERFQGSSEIGAYGDFLHELDWSVGEVLDSLDRCGFADNTLVLLSSDNGACVYHRVDYLAIEGHRANGPLRGQKTEVYEGGHRVPLLVRWPGHVAPNTSSDALVALTDVFATLCELLGQSLPEDGAEDSFSFLHALKGKAPHWPVRQSLVHDSYHGQFAIRSGYWKLVPFVGGGGIGWNPETADDEAGGGQLYCLKSDLAEKHNLFDTNPETVAELTMLLARIREADSSRSVEKSMDHAKASP